MKDELKTAVQVICDDTERPDCVTKEDFAATVRLFRAAPALYEALIPFAEVGINLQHLNCHEGLCIAAVCSRCSKVLAVRAALALVESEGA